MASAVTEGMTDIRNELERAKDERTAAIASVVMELRSELASANEERTAAIARVESEFRREVETATRDKPAPIEAVMAKLRSEIDSTKQWMSATLTKRLAGLRKEVEGTKSEIGNLRSAIENVKQEMTAMEARLIELQSEAEVARKGTTTMIRDSAARIRNELQQLHHERAAAIDSVMSNMRKEVDSAKEETEHIRTAMPDLQRDLYQTRSDVGNKLAQLQADLEDRTTQTREMLLNALHQSIDDQRLEITNQIHTGLEAFRGERDEQIARVKVDTAATITFVQRLMQNKVDELRGAIGEGAGESNANQEGYCMAGIAAILGLILAIVLGRTRP
jgi:predicted  nucleic acid-binding Zn-ribbon protein